MGACRSKSAVSEPDCSECSKKCPPVVLPPSRLHRSNSVTLPGQQADNSKNEGCSSGSNSSEKKPLNGSVALEKSSHDSTSVETKTNSTGSGGTGSTNVSTRDGVSRGNSTGSEVDLTQSGYVVTAAPGISAHDSMLQELLEVYNVGKMIGQGGSGQVFEVIHKETGIKYACKVVHKDQDLNVDKTMRLEAEIMKRMQHENVAGLYEIFETSSSKWLVLEYAEEGNVQSALASLPATVTYNEVLISDLFRQMLKGVQYLHKMGIVHRDLKQDNILCTTGRSNDSSSGNPSGTDLCVKITDFGLSAVVCKLMLKDQMTGEKMKAYTELSEMWGTPGYFAPEVYNKAYGPQADVWSLGCVLYELLTGQMAFPERETAPTLVDRVVTLGAITKTPRVFELPQAWKELTPEVQHLIKGMLQFDPRKRLSIDECLVHPWVCGNFNCCADLVNYSDDEEEDDEDEEEAQAPAAEEGKAGDGQIGFPVASTSSSSRSAKRMGTTSSKSNSANATGISSSGSSNSPNTSTSTKLTSHCPFQQRALRKKQASVLPRRDCAEIEAQMQRPLKHAQEAARKLAEKKLFRLKMLEERAAAKQAKNQK